MDPKSLKFYDESIEAQFQQSTENKINSQFLWLIVSFIAMGFLAILIEIINQNYITMGLYCGQLILYVGTYLYIRKNRSESLKLLKLFNKVNFLLPGVNILYSIFGLVSLESGINIILMTFLYAPLFNSSYNIIQDAILICILIFTSIYHCSYLIGFTPHYLMILSPIAQLIYQRYQQVKIERTLFSQSLVNQSLVDVITKVCKENIIIFTYNLDQRKYEKKIINETAKSHFNTDILGEILKEIHIKNYPMETDISSFIFRNCIQQKRRGEFQLKGYYKSKVNAILITLYVTQYQNIQIILKIEKKEEKVLKIQKTKKLINFQLRFLQNLLQKFQDCLRTSQRIEIPHFKFYHYLHKSIIFNKLQIINIAKCTKIAIQKINLKQMIEKIFIQWDLKHFIKAESNNISISNTNQDSDINIINSSKVLVELILQVMTIILRKIVLDKKEFILIKIIQSDETTQINFCFKSKRFTESLRFLKSSLTKLIYYIGLDGSLSIQEKQINFKILRELGQRF